jgi:hypothetical protein
MLWAGHNAFQYHAPDYALIQRLSGVVGEDQAAVAESVSLRAVGLSGDGRGYGVEILPLGFGKVKVRIDDTVLEK